MKSIKRNCPICHSEKIVKQLVLDVYDFDDTNLDRDLIIVSCEKCGMIYNICNMGSDLDAYYENDAVYDSVVGVGSGGSTSWDIDRYDGYVKFFESIPVQKGKRLVDVGSARGGFLAYLREHGFTSVSGVEINPRCAQYALSNYSVIIDIGSANRLPLPDCSVDILTYTHVFEHVYDLHHVVGEAIRVLREDGMLFVDVPDASRYGECSISNYYVASIREHINHFDVHHLKTMFKIAGFDCIRCKQQLASYNSSFVFPTIAGLFKKTAGNLPSWPFEIDCNNELLTSFKEYMKNNEIVLNSTRKLVREIARSGKPVYIWGIGLEFFGLYGMAGLKRCNVKKLIDKNHHKQSRQVDGLEVVGPEELLDVSADSVVFLTSALHKQDMLNYLGNIQFKGTAIPLSLFLQ